MVGIALMSPLVGLSRPTLFQRLQLQRDFAPPKGGERPAALTPQRDSPRPEELRRAAGRLLVAGTRVRGLLLCAKHLFVAAILGWTASEPPHFSRNGTPPRDKNRRHGTDLDEAALDKIMAGCSRSWPR
jgi:hypothetical protein